MGSKWQMEKHNDPYYKKAKQEDNRSRASYKLKQLDKKFKILRDEICKPYPKVKLDKRKSEALDNLNQLLAMCPKEKDYIKDLIEIIRSYDDLSDGELKYLANLSIRKSNIDEIVPELKQKIPVHYIIQIKTRVENIDAQTEIIMFTEDLRNDIK